MIQEKKYIATHPRSLLFCSIMTHFTAVLKLERNVFVVVQLNISTVTAGCNFENKK